ncbi:MAG: TetR/AcrR family transcriptional regulator C-terminal domain-containing protein, partial [Tepidanaerobacteraceae bacterium]|nr:TetR/AcrR family transcriptional regulator C-terminal domain-containing protein [Tepidanaerobacteraceae bacterium]
MSEITKKALAASFMKLLNQTTLDKITIKDIVDKCGVNRNTFYYHFQDVYDLMDWIFITEAKQVIDENKTYNNWQQGFLQSANYLLENKKLVYHAYNSLSREQLERYLYNISDNI